MHEPAALTMQSALTDLELPPVTDVFRDAEFDALAARVAATELAVAESRYDDVVELLEEAVVAPSQ